MWMKTDIRRPFGSVKDNGGVARQHPCLSEEYGGAVGGSSTKMEQDVPKPHRETEWAI